MGTELSPGDKWLLTLVLIAGTAVFVHRLVTILRLIRAGRAERRLDHFCVRLSHALLYIFGQTRVFRNRLVGTAHLVIFYGFLVVVVGTLNMLSYGLLGQAFVPGITDSIAFAWLLDILAALVIVGVVVSAYRRYVVHPPEVYNSLSSALVLAAIFLLMVTLLLTEASERQLGIGSRVPPIGAMLAGTLEGLNRQQLVATQAAAWWAHVLLVTGFLAYIPYSKHLHLIFCPFNEFLRSLHPKGELVPADGNSVLPFSGGGFNQLGWKQLMDLFACTECGRCLQYCPAYVSGSPLSPRQMILDLRAGLLQTASDRTVPQSSTVPIADAIGRDAIWSCTTCRACQEHCPVFIEHIDKIVEARRCLLELEGAPPTLSKALEGLALLGNPQMLPASERDSFIEGLNVPLIPSAPNPEIVVWLGCAGAYESAAQDTMKALIRVLKAAGIQFSMLGSAEKCCGDPARRSGEEGLFKDLALHNIAALESLGVRKLLTACPHCYNTFKNEYPRLGAAFAVVHHSDFILKLLNEQRINLDRPSNQVMTYHDPCYLGRYNEIYDAPREVLRGTIAGNIVEMRRRRDTSLCCGGGGSQMYLESTAGTRINRLRFIEAEELSVQVLATACPFCKIMMEDAASYNTAGPKVRVKDIAELVAEAISN